MKKILALFLTLILLVSCGAQDNDTAVTTAAEITDTISEEERAEIEKRLIETSHLEGYTPEGYISRSVCDGGDCYYFLVQGFMHQALYCMDKATLEPKILCDIEGCEHDKKSCQACIGGSAGQITYDDGRLYWFSNESIPGSAKMHISNVIWCMDLETKVRAKLGKIDNPEGAQSDQVFGKGCAMALSLLHDENGYEQICSEQIGTRLKLSTKEKTELFRKSIKFHNGSQYFYDNSFYCTAVYNDVAGNAAVCAYKWDLESGEETELSNQTVEGSALYFSETGDASGINLYSLYPDYAGGFTAYRLDYSDGKISKIADFDFTEYGSRYDYTNNPEGSIRGYGYVDGVMYAMVKTSAKSLAVVGKDESGGEVFKTTVDNLNVTEYAPHVTVMGADKSYIFLGFTEQILSRNYQMNIVAAIPTDGSEPIIVGEHISDLAYRGW